MLCARIAGVVALVALGCANEPSAGDGASSEGSGGSSGTTGAAETTASTVVESSTGDAASSSGGDVSSSGDESSTGTPVATMPVFVALGDGGWTASSCDGGQTWTAHAFSDEQGDHTQWTAFGGLAYGQGSFVAGLGWGGDGGHILRSLDGRTWEDLPAGSFVDAGTPIGYAIYTSGVAAIDNALMIFSQRVWRSTDGNGWVTTEVGLPPGAEQLRQLRGFPASNLLVAAVESQSGTAHPVGNFVVVSDDGGMTWNEGTGFVSSCADGIQHGGDIEAIGDVILVGTGDVCRSSDRGATWEPIAQPIGEAIQDIFHDGKGLLAVSGTRILRSLDGVAWNDHADTGIALRSAAWADGAYAAVSTMGTDLLWSDDGGFTWNAGTVQDEVPGERWVRDFIGVTIEGECDG